MGVKKGQTGSDLMIKLTTELGKESDRALAILAGSHLEYLLECLISSALNLPTEEAEKFLFEGDNAGLATFSAKIEMAYRLKLLNEDEKRDLTLIRKVRNEFAHHLIGISFTTPNIADRCKTLKFAQIDGTPPTARECYQKASIRLMVEILLKTQSAKKEIK